MGDSSNTNVQQAEELKLRANDAFKGSYLSQKFKEGVEIFLAALHHRIQSIPDGGSGMVDQDDSGNARPGIKFNSSDLLFWFRNGWHGRKRASSLCTSHLQLQAAPMEYMEWMNFMGMDVVHMLRGSGNSEMAWCMSFALVGRKRVEGKRAHNLREKRVFDP